MKGSSVFLDNNSTTPLLPEVIQAMLDCLKNLWANPSSGYSSASEVRCSIEKSREQVAALVGATPECVIFTSGGTEANNMAVLSGLDSMESDRKKFVTSEIEHASILSMIPKLESSGVEVVKIGADSSGTVRLNDFLDAIDHSTGLVSLQWVNNETGVIQPVRQIAERCREVGACFHTDASQAIGKFPIDFAKTRFDYLTFTGHKLHAPKGIGAVVFRKKPRRSMLLSGGSQELGIRPGTENVAGIIGLGVASQVRAERLVKIASQLDCLRNRFEEGILSCTSEIVINGVNGERVPNTSNLRFTGVAGEAIINELDILGIECSQSSACTQARPEPSHVLTAMGLNEDEAYSSVRFSFSELNTREETEIAISAVADVYAKLKARCLALAG